MTSLALERKLVSQEMHIALLWAVEITHRDDPNGLYLVNNTKDLRINSLTYVAMPFDITFDQEGEDGNSRLQIKFSNIDQTLGDFFRSKTTPATATVKLIASDSTAVSQAEWSSLRCANLIRTREIVALSFETHQLSSSRFPLHTFTPDMFPGSFK